MADGMIYLTRLADILEIDLIKAAHAKLDEGESRYPGETYRTSARAGSAG